LRDFPGPLLDNISEIPTVLALIGGKQHAYVRGLQDRYGNVVRVSPNKLSFLDPEAWDQIYAFR
ncbi:hypothetical protein QBC35DRAFT_370500, partial [Podospora australis]